MSRGWSEAERPKLNLKSQPVADLVMRLQDEKVLRDLGQAACDGSKVKHYLSTFIHIHVHIYICQ